MPDTPKENSANELAVRIRLSNVDDVPLEHANHHYIHHAVDSFYVIFSQIVPPPVLLMSEAERAGIEHIDAKVVSKLIMTAAEFKSFLDAANTNYSNWQNEAGPNQRPSRRSTRKK